MIEIDSKYFDTEKKSNEDLDNAKSALKKEQKMVENIIGQFSYEHLRKNIDNIKNINLEIDKVQNLLNENNISMAMNILHNCKTQLTNLVQNIDESEDSAKISEVNSKNESIKKLQEEYACLLYTSPSPRDGLLSRMPSSA